VDGPLRIRSKPSTADDSVKYPETLPTGEKVYVIAGPVRSSDYDWYLVHPLGGWEMGWVAAADHDGTPWLQPGTIGCPSDTTLETLANLQLAVRLFCYGPQEFTFRGTVAVPPLGCGEPAPDIEPRWFNPCSAMGMHESEDSDDLSLDFVVPPEIEGELHRSEEEVRFVEGSEIVVHMDDAAAERCTGGDDAYPDEVGYPEFPDPRAIVFVCRTLFVASSVLMIGP
jgi:hypothetical protein